jgi:hypothetical protein
VIQLVLSIVLGLGLVALLYLFWMRDRSRAEGGAAALLDAQNSLKALKLGLLPETVVNRIFASEDFEFAAASCSLAVQSALQQERKKLALLWVDQVRRQILNLRRFHFGRSRFYARLSIKTELGLAAAFSMLLIDCQVLRALVYLRGPRAFPVLAGRTIGAASRVCGVSEQSIAFLNASDAGASSRRQTGSHVVL